MNELKEFFDLAWDPTTKQCKGKLKWPFNNQDNILENWVMKYFTYCSIVGEDAFIEKILSGLNIFGNVIPRARYYGDVDMIATDPNNMWVKRLDFDGIECQMRVDTGTGQAPCLLGLHLIRDKFPKADTLARRFSQEIANNKFVVKYDDITVPQGKFLTVIPPLGNNCIEALCISKIAGVNLPWPHRWRAGISVGNAMPWDDPMQRSLLLWFLKKVMPVKYGEVFNDWIMTRDEDVVKARAYKDSITDMQNTKWLKSRLDVLLQDAIRS